MDHQEQKLRETGKIELKMLYIRMNRFAYGYQDEIIRMIDTLERFEDFNLERNSESINFNPKTKDSQAENPK